MTSMTEQNITFSGLDEVTHKRDIQSGLPLTDEACLVVIYGGAHLGKRYPLAGATRIGRGADNQIALRSHDVSRHHAELRLVRDRWFVSDLLSTNGTQLNGRSIEGETVLSNGDYLNVGGVIFKFIAGGNVESLFHEEIYRMTVYDGLTGLHNKRFVDEFLEREIARTRRHLRPLSFAMIDVDHFKQINDTYGHLAGDHVLNALGTLLTKNVRREETIGRWGGEEFAFVLAETDLSQATIACEKLRRLIECEPFEFGGAARPVTVSIGVATFCSEMTRDQLVRAADQRLYAAKGAGRNRVAAAG